MGKWLWFGESVRIRFIFLVDVPAIVLGNIYRKAHTTCLTISCRRGVFDIHCHFVDTAKASLGPVRERGNGIPSNRTRTDVVLCHGACLYLLET